jgi:hypothetical protein
LLTWKRWQKNCSHRKSSAAVGEDALKQQKVCVVGRIVVGRRREVAEVLKYGVNVRSKPLLAVRYESQVYTII